MKKGGFDLPLKALDIIFDRIKPQFLLLMNMIFFLCYPFQFSTSLLCAIPKKGDLSKATNYRGIQMLSLFASFFDKIIASRLTQWANISPEQSAYIRGRSTTDQLFYLHLIIELCKKRGVCLYIGLFDLSKAFDNVSRFNLLKRLITLGISAQFFSVIKAMYSSTFCVLKLFGKLSTKFETFIGIRQGASSSCILFIVYMDKLIESLRQKCIVEPILGSIHCILHADDTLVLSTSRELFILKCISKIW